MLESDYKPCRELDICNELNNNTSTPSNSEDTQNINLLDYQHLTESYILGRQCTYMVGLVERGNGIPPVIERVESFSICDTRWGRSYLNLRDKHKKYTEILLPGWIEEIGPWGCCSQYQLKKIFLPENLKRIELYAFAGCTSITELLIPPKVEYIGWGAFVGCPSLQAILVDEASEFFESVDGVLFSKGRKILYVYPAHKTDSEYQVPDTVEEIYDNAFQGNKYLRRLYIPAATSKICEHNAFNDCENLCEVCVCTENKIYESDGGVLLTKGKKRLLLYPPQKQGCVYHIPSEVVEIEQYAFQNCNYLMNVVIPPNVSIINFCTFDGCRKLVEVLMPNTSLKQIRGCAFRNCTNLSTFQFPETLEVIDTSSFMNCKSLRSIYLPSKLCILSQDSFWGCNKLTSVRVSSDNETFWSNGRCVFRKDNQEVVFFCPGSLDKFL